CTTAFGATDAGSFDQKTKTNQHPVVLLGSGLPLSSEFESGQSTPTPVFQGDLFNHHEGRVERLVEDVQQYFADALDEQCLLFRRGCVAIGTGSFTRTLYIDHRHDRSPGWPG